MLQWGYVHPGMMISIDNYRFLVDDGSTCRDMLGKVLVLWFFCDVFFRHEDESYKYPCAMVRYDYEIPPDHQPNTVGRQVLVALSPVALAWII